MYRFPKRYIVKRWTKDVVPNEIKYSFETGEFGDDKTKEARRIAREIVLGGEYLANSLISDLAELTLVNDQIKEMVKKVDEGRFKRPNHQSKHDRYASLLGYEKPSNAEPTIRLPNGIKNKGRGKQKRIKSSKEVKVSRSGKRKRNCAICGESGHDRRKHAKEGASTQTTQTQGEQDDQIAEDDVVDNEEIELEASDDEEELC